MSTKLKAGTATSGAVIDADTSGILELQSGSTPTTAITIDASQNVGVGTSSMTGTGNLFLGGAYSGLYYNNATGNMFIGSSTSTPIAFGTALTERMRIDSSGNLLVGTGTVYATLGASVQVANSGGKGQYAAGPGNAAQTFSFGRDNVSTGNFVFAYNGSVIASISSSTGVYTPLSDSRVKKNIEPLNYGLNEVLNLNPVSYNMVTEEDSDKKHIGLIAQEVKTIIDEAVADLKDPDNEMYGLATSELVPVLINAIKELNAKVTALEAQLGVK